MNDKSILIELIKDFNTTQMQEFIELISSEYNIAVKYTSDNKWLISSLFDDNIPNEEFTNEEIIEHALNFSHYTFNDLLNEIILIKGV